MSSYINFFVRISTDNFIPLGDFSRSSELYRQLMATVSYEKICPISKRTLGDTLTDIYKSIDNLKEEIKKLQDKISIVPTYNNSINDKESLIEEYEFRIDEINEEIEDKLFSAGILNSYICMIEVVEYNDKLNIDKDKYIYAGIEVPEQITEDIIIALPR